MSTPIEFEGHMDASGHRFTLVVGRFNHFIVDRLVEGAMDALIRHGADPGDLTIVRAPGAWELPIVCQKVMARGGVDVVIALGAVIRGSTPHFDYVANECAKGIAQASMASGIPVAFGVLTCDTIEQAIERAGTKAGNKGWEAATAAIEMADLMNNLDVESSEA